MSTVIVHCPPAGVDDDHEDKPDGGGKQGGEREESNCSERVLFVITINLMYKNSGLTYLI